jgi:hypothetical protein
MVSVAALLPRSYIGARMVETYSEGVVAKGVGDEEPRNCVDQMGYFGLKRLSCFLHHPLTITFEVQSGSGHTPLAPCLTQSPCTWGVPRTRLHLQSLARLAAELDADAAGAASGAVPDAALLSDGSHRTFTVHSDTGFGGGL